MSNPSQPPSTESPANEPTLIQPELIYQKSKDSERVTVRSRGPFGALLDEYNAMEVGKTGRGLEGLRLKSAVLTREPGGLGFMEEVYGSDSSAVRQSGHARAIQTDWRFFTTAQDVSVYRYCGPSVGANANRRRIETWYANYLQEQSDAAVGEDTVADEEFFSGLTEADQKIARKLLEGKETVMRHYPTIQKITSYSGGGSLDFTGGLDRIADGIAGAPDWMVERAESWLKTQEDVDETSDGHRQLTESWIGGDEFDEDFYGAGADRWEFGSV